MVSSQPSGSTDEDDAKIPLLEADSSSEEERRPQTNTPMVFQGCELPDTHTLVNGVNQVAHYLVVVILHNRTLRRDVYVFCGTVFILT